jgi:2-methylisocitrate lyase-like PEP mutase family enzyme
MTAGGAATPTKTRLLRQLLDKPGVHQVPDAFNAMAAGIAQGAGFEALYTGGHMMGAMNLGIIDWGLITTTEMVEISARIAAAVSIPVICDADQGGETSLNVYRTVREFEHRGIAGIHIEDTYNPKHAGHPIFLTPDPADRLQPVDEMNARISAAVAAKKDPDFVIIARTDALLYKQPIDEAISRVIAFEQAGADAIFVTNMTPEQIDEIANEVTLPLIGLNYPLDAVKNTKLKLNLWAGVSTTAVLETYLACLRELQDTGTMSYPKMGDPFAYQIGITQIAQPDDYTKIVKHWRQIR